MFANSDKWEKILSYADTFDMQHYMFSVSNKLLLNHTFMLFFEYNEYRKRKRRVVRLLEMSAVEKSAASILCGR